jgi:5-formyltetrahydrofolate cyclo-ligase
MSDPKTETRDLRARARKARRSMSPPQRRRASRRISDLFLNSRFFLASDSLGCYLSTWDEVDTSAIIERAWRAKKRLFLPVTSTRGDMRFCETLPDTKLTLNHFGIWEPLNCDAIDASRLDVVVTPLVAFDDHRNRIGMGGGYFDRTFAFLGERNHWLRPKLIGVAFECQRVEKILPNPWDIPVFRVFSETDQ